MCLLPLSLPLYFIGIWEQKQLRQELQIIHRTDKEIADIARKLHNEQNQ